MALDPRQITRTCDDSIRHLDRMKQELRQINNDYARMGSDFRNDRRFSSDSYKWKDSIREVERAIDKMKSIVDSVKRSNR